MPLAKPDTTERARTAEQLDRAETLTSDQRLLRVLLDDDQTEFERALRERLVAHRESVGPDPAARACCRWESSPWRPSPASRTGWQLGTRSGYLPAALLSARNSSKTAAGPHRPPAQVAPASKVSRRIQGAGSCTHRRRLHCDTSPTAPWAQTASPRGRGNTRLQVREHHQDH
ncbi:Imm49 family immunity protein [Streptomyces cirratus]